MTAPTRIAPSGSSKETVAALVDLDKAIRHADPPPKGLRIFGWVFLVFIAAGIVALTMASDEGTPRRTTAALFCFVIVGIALVSPLIASRPSGVLPQDVRHLPVSATALRGAAARVMLGGAGLIGMVATLLIVPLAYFTDPDAGLTAKVVATVVIIPTAGLGVLGPRVLGLVFAQAMRTQTGRIVSTVAGVVAIAGVYLVYLLLSQGIIDPRNEALQIAARVVPTGWPIVAGEAIDDGRWWLAVLVVVVLALILALMYRAWATRLDQAMYSDAIASSASSRTATARRPITSSPTLLILKIEARMLVTDPQRLALAIMPLAFVVIGVVLMFGLSDLYGMQYGAPAVLYMVGGMLSNTYGLDRWGFAVLVTSPHAAPLVVRSRMLLAAALAVPVAVVGTVVARALRDTDPGTWPVAISVIIGGSVTASAMAGMMPALCPYRVPTGSGISSTSSRGSMSGQSLALSLAGIPAMALMCAPGVVIGLLVDGPLAYIGVLLELAIAIPLLLVAYRHAVRLVRQRGPEILTIVTAVGPAEAPKKEKKSRRFSKARPS